MQNIYCFETHISGVDLRARRIAFNACEISINLAACDISEAQARDYLADTLCPEYAFKTVHTGFKSIVIEYRDFPDCISDAGFDNFVGFFGELNELTMQHAFPHLPSKLDSDAAIRANLQGFFDTLSERTRESIECEKTYKTSELKRIGKTLDAYEESDSARAFYILSEYLAACEIIPFELHDSVCEALAKFIDSNY
jgi:hypothetical protein